ncbi:DUF4340 domain-containing protein [Bdellovibrio sp. HCB274]|uniref:DUF4340 domain-containing protein n=1 Tax=Bdellovibrio sp. HCB274 TaxID=3394361 RepID=UPI0039B4DDF9
MKKIKGRGILVMCLLIFGGYALYDFLAQKKADEQKVAEAKLFTMNVDQIDFIEITKDAKVIALRRTVEGWNMEQPLKDQADDSAAEDLIKMTSSEKVMDIAADGGNIDWKVYGLDQPQGSITFANSAGQKTTLHISSKGNFENFPFARRDDDNRVLVVNTNWTARLEKPVVEFRDRRFLRHKIGSIENFHLKNKHGVIQITNKDGKWVSTSDSKVELDQQKVRETFRNISNAKGADYVEGALPSLKSLFTLDLKLGDKNWQAQVGQATTGKIYSAVSDPKVQMMMEPGALDELIELKIEDLKVGSTPKQDSKEQTGAQLAQEKDNK